MPAALRLPRMPWHAVQRRLLLATEAAPVAARLLVAGFGGAWSGPATFLPCYLN